MYVAHRRFLVLAALIAVASLTFFGVLSVTAQDDGQGAEMQVDAYAQLLDAAGTPVGTVRFIDEPEYGTVALVVQAQNLTPGFHGLHIHQTGQCDPAGDSPFSSAGGHWDPAGGSHPNHAGDLPVLLVMQDGTAAMSFRTDRFAVQDLFDEDGSALIVHANADNYANIPADYLQEGEQLLDSTTSSGDGGARVACGVVMQGDVPVEPQPAPDTGDMTAEPEMDSDMSATPETVG